MKRANPGDIVIYNGEFEHAIDSLTERLMKERLIPGNRYKVEGIRSLGIYRGYYTIDNCFYPPKSFNVSRKALMIEKYGLR